jgi:hypothetical protein
VVPSDMRETSTMTRWRSCSLRRSSRLRFQVSSS